MPKEAPEDQAGEVHQDISRGAGANDEKLLIELVTAAEARSMEIEEIMRDAAQAAQPHVDEIKAIKKRAAEAGIPKKVFSAKLRERGLLRKADKCRETLSEEQRDEFDELTAKLEQLDLFAAEKATLNG
jgi:hypothetical protein